MHDQSNADAGGFHVPGTPIEIAWAAGLFEGEGCIHCKPQGKRGSGVQLRLGMTDRDCVERFQRIVGCGRIYAHKPGTGSHKPTWTWYVYDARKATAILNSLLPYLGKRRAAKALEALEVAANIVAYADRTHCPKGHPYDGDNLMLEPIRRKGKTYFARRCRECRLAQMREAARKRRARRRAEQEISEISES